RTAARRIWFVVDRRVVVDEAFERAERLASRLADENAPAAIRAVAERLLQIRGLDSQKRPLAVGRLRGGVLRDDRWARILSQASIITSTVDQLGSRLLFRSYGDSPLAAPVYAGLAGNDSLILLDEAHCAVPFLQTLRAVQLFRSSKWAEVENPTPFHVTILSATPRSEGEEKPLEVFPAEAERERALNHPKLQDRLSASKKATLQKVKDEEALAKALVDAAETFARGQRFGRLDRLGALRGTHAFILTADSLLKDSDPIYGDALRNTWEFLHEKATVENPGTKQERHVVDFGVNALDPLLPEGDDL